MQNLATDLQEIGATMARALGNADEQVTATFAAEANALHSLLRDTGSVSSGPEHKPHEVLDQTDKDLTTWHGLNDVGPPEYTAERDGTVLDHLFVPPPGAADGLHAEPSTYEVHADRAPGASSNRNPIDDPGGGHQDRAEGRTSSERAAEARRMWLTKGQEIGEMIHNVVIEPDYELLEPPRGAEVDDPVTAVTISMVALWELIV